MKTRDSIRSAARELPREELGALVADLLNDLGDDEELSQEDREAAWGAELTRRLEGLESGRLKTVPAGIAFAQIRERLKSRHG